MNKINTVFLKKQTHMASINPHIHFNGNTEIAFEFYKSVFGGEFGKITRFKDLQTEGFQFPEEELNKIMHISLPIGEGGMLMGSDVPSMLGTVNEMENRSKITITASSKEEADHLFKGLSAGGDIEFPIGDSPWGSYFGAFRDQFGIEWMVSFG
jgi:PhnB protein